MDVEAAIEFLVQEGARLDARQDRFDRQLKILVRLGMQVSRRAFNAIDRLAESQRGAEDWRVEFAEWRRVMAEGQKRLADTQQSLTTQQQETEARLGALIKLFERQQGGNGTCH